MNQETCINIIEETTQKDDSGCNFREVLVKGPGHKQGTHTQYEKTWESTEY